MSRRPVRSDHFRPLVTQLEGRETPAVGFALSNNALIAFDTSAPALANPAVAITTAGGFINGENFVGIDFRPQNGLLYGLTATPSGGGSAVRLYAISTQTGVATPLAAAQTFTSDAQGTPVLVQGTNFGFDFNPAADRIRVVTDAGVNFRMNPNTGLIVDGNNDGTAPNPANGVNPDGPLTQGGDASRADGSAYTNNNPNAFSTVLYALDSGSNRFFIQNPNTGTLVGGATGQGTVITTDGTTPLDFDGVNGFDYITATTGTAPGQAFAILTVDGSTNLYTIDVGNGAATGIATPLGSFGTTAIQGLAVQPEQPNSLDPGTPLIVLDAETGEIVRLTSSPTGATAATTAVALQNGETLVGLDFRPATGQLYGLGINADNNNGTLYLIDPQGANGTATATAVGTVGGVAFTTNGTTAVDLPDPAEAGYGFDFNPTVDRIRVTTSTGLNFRLDPTNSQPAGVAVDGNNVGAATPAVAGTNPDAGINTGTGTGTTGLDAAAYTNSYAGTSVTTLYGIDTATGSLYVQNNPNGGATQLVGPLGILGTIEAVNGFDIPANVRTTATNAAVPSGFGFAVLTATNDGVTNNLPYRIDLTTGEATVLESFGPTGRRLSGLTAAATPAGAVQFTGLTAVVAAEGGPAATFTLTRSGGSSGQVSVTVTPSPSSTAVAGSDYTFTTPFVVTFADGATTATVTIPIVDDAVPEGVEAVAFSLTGPTNGLVLAAQNTATLTISDNDAPPTGGAAPARLRAVGSGGGQAGDSTVVVYNADNSVRFTLAPFAGFNGPVTVAVGDITGDMVDDVAVGAGAGGGPRLRVFDGATQTTLADFYVYEPQFGGGITVAIGDVNGDDRGDVIIGAGFGGGPRVRVFSGANLAVVLADFYAFDPNFGGGVTVAAGDVAGDGRAEILVGTGVGRSGQVRAFGLDDLRNALVDLPVFEPGFTGGVFVGYGTRGGSPVIIAGAGKGGGPRVSLFDPATGAELATDYVFDKNADGSSNFAGGVRVGFGFGKLLVGAGPGRQGQDRQLDIDLFGTANPPMSQDGTAFGPDFMGGVFVGGSADGRTMS